MNESNRPELQALARLLRSESEAEIRALGESTYGKRGWKELERKIRAVTLTFELRKLAEGRK